MKKGGTHISIFHQCVATRKQVTSLNFFQVTNSGETSWKVELKKHDDL